ncbi:unnamed protein product [Cyclocybe aegerita]|uniref:F-box domain-containing protein n=1 Tax=Cyclocybe aegerita TaxID=1973307 RepID=A0A8S0XNA4_CYCAE|nr:unnamed protein product [Cyclocybe aegerita]
MSGLILPTDQRVTQDFLANLIGSRWEAERATLQPPTPMQPRPHTEVSEAPVMGSSQIAGSVMLHSQLEDFSPEAFALDEREQEKKCTTKVGNVTLSLVPSKRPNALLRLPTELTAMIFELAQDQSPFGHGRFSSKRYYTEAAVSQVCRQWRAISIDRRPLWTTFFHRDNRPSVDRPETILHRLHTYIQRAAPREVDLYAVTGDPKLAALLIDEFTRYATRWRRVIIQIPTGAEACLAHLSEVKFSAMERLDVFIPHCTNMGPYSAPANSFTAPKLKCVEMDCAAFKLCKPPLSTVTILYLESLSVDELPTSATPVLDLSEFMEVVKSAVSLKSLTVVGSCVSGELFGDPPGTVLTNIEELICSSEFVATNFWSKLYAPRLAKVELIGVELFAIIPDGDTSYSSDNLPALTNVKFNNVVVTETWMKRLALNAKNVTHIELENEDMSEDLWIGLDHRVLNPLDALAECDATSGPGRYMWPKLTSIFARIEPFGTPQWEAYAPLLKQRKGCQLLLPEHHVQLWKEEDGENWKELEEMGRVAGVVYDEAE